MLRSPFAPSARRGGSRRSRARIALLAAVLVVWPVAACMTIPEPPAGCANCPVCVQRGDLACVCVHVEADTPAAEWNGRKWYFCSDSCRASFLADPRHFTPSR